MSGVLGELAYENGPEYTATIRATGPGGTADANLVITAVNVLGVSGSKVQYLAGTSDGQYRVRFVSEEAPMGRTVVDFEVLTAPRPIEPRNVTAIYAAGGTVYDGYTPTDSAGGVEETLTVDRGTPAGGEVDQVVVRNVYDDASKGSWLMGAWGVDCLVAGDGWATQSSPTTITQAALDAAGDGPYVLPGGANAQYLIETDLTVPKFGIAAGASGQKIFCNNGSTLWFAADGPSAGASYPPTLSARPYGILGGYNLELYGLTVRQGPEGAYFSYTYKIDTYDAATTYGLIRHETTVSVSAGQGSIEATTDALVTALNASADPLFSAITWTRESSGTSSYILAVHDTADTPFSVYAYNSGGSGAWALSFEAPEFKGPAGDATFGRYAIAARTIRRARDCVFEVSGIRSDAYLFEKAAYSQDVSIVNCTFKTRGYHGNRHQGWACIQSDGSSTQTGALRWQRNTMDASHLGIRIRFDGADADHPLIFSHNVIEKSSTDGIVNDYGLNGHGRYQCFWSNVVNGNKQGVHLDGTDAPGQDIEVLDNEITVGPAPHADFTNSDVHGIKHEFAHNVFVSRNKVHALTEATDMPDRNAHALNVSGWDGATERGRYILTWDATTTYTVTRGGVSYSTVGEASDDAALADLVDQITTDADPAWLADDALRYVTVGWVPAPTNKSTLYARYYLWETATLGITWDVTGGTGAWSAADQASDYLEAPQGVANSGAEIQKNIFESVAPTTAMSAVGLLYEYTTGISDGTYLKHNVFRASTRLVQLMLDPNYDRPPGDVLEKNAWEHETTSALGQVAYAACGIAGVDGIVQLNPQGGLDWSDFDATKSADAGTKHYELFEDYTLTVRVIDDMGSAVSGATVTVDNDSAVEQFTGSTDANGILQGTVRRRRMANLDQTTFTPATVTDYNDMDVTVSKAGKTTYNGDHTVAQQRILTVTLQDDPTTSTAAFDTSTPDAPTDGVAYERSCTGAYVAWTAPTFAGGISHYEVYVGGVLHLVTEETADALPGLDPATEYTTVTVKAVGNNGVASTALTLPTFTTQAENRGSA